MIIAGDKVKFNESYDFPDELKHNTYTVSSVGVIAGQPFVWLDKVSGFFPCDSIKLVQKGFVDWVADDE